MRASLLAIAIAAMAAVLYTARLSDVPRYLMQDEVNFALQADAIAATGRDLGGRRLPVYFSEPGFEAGRDPVMTYWTALFLTVMPTSPSSVRLPTAILALISIVLVAAVASRILGRDSFALAAALFLVCTPAFFANSRLALSIVYPIPFVLAWLWAIANAERSNDRRWPLLAGLALGAGVYSYVGSVAMMPVYLLLTLWMMPRGKWAPLIGGFAIALIPLIVWQVLHPERYSELVYAYQPAAATSTTGLRGRLSAFWMFFNPAYLFVYGDGRGTNSIPGAGLFPLAGLVLIPAGLVHLWRQSRPLPKVIVIGFIAAPLATALSGRLDINRVLYAIPFGAIAAAAGLAGMSRSSRSWMRVVAILLAASVPLQFAFLYRDYLVTYHEQNAAWFGDDQMGAAMTALEHLPASGATVYLDRRSPIERYWRLAAAMKGRRDLAESPVYFEEASFDLGSIGSRGVLVCSHGGRLCSHATGSGEWQLISARVEPDGRASLDVYQRK